MAEPEKLPRATAYDIELLIMAHRFLYHVLGQPVISDSNYDRLQSLAETELGAASAVFKLSALDEKYYSNSIKVKARELLAANKEKHHV